MWRNDCQNVDFTADDPAKTGETLAYILLGIYTFCGFITIAILWIFVDDMEMAESESNHSDKPSDMLKSSIRHFLSETRQQLLVFLTMYSGFKQAFKQADMTKSFISCPLGIAWIGFILCGCGLSDSVFSFLFGRMAGWIGDNNSRGMLIGLALGLDIMNCTAMLLWDPQPTGPNGALPFFWIPLFWGVSDAVIQTQINVIYGSFFGDRQDAAFGNYRFWESLGFIVVFGYQGYTAPQWGRMGGPAVMNIFRFPVYF